MKQVRTIEHWIGGTQTPDVDASCAGLEPGHR